jgi:hypothetical protein
MIVWQFGQLPGIPRKVNPAFYIKLLHSNFFLGDRPQKLRANFSQFGQISSIAQPKNLLNWGNFAQIERNSPEIFGAKLNCAGSPISGEKNNYCVQCMFLGKLSRVWRHSLLVYMLEVEKDTFICTEEI